LQARLGELYLNLYDYKQSLIYWERVLKDKNYITEQNDSAKALIYHCVAVAYCHNEQLESSIKMWQQSSYYVKKCYGEKSPRMALEYSGMALVYYKQQNFLHAVELLNEAYSILEKECGKDYRATRRIAKLREDWRKKLNNQ